MMGGRRRCLRDGLRLVVFEGGAFDCKWVHTCRYLISSRLSDDGTSAISEDRKKPFTNRWTIPLHSLRCTRRLSCVARRRPIDTRMLSSRSSNAYLTVTESEASQSAQSDLSVTLADNHLHI